MSPQYHQISISHSFKQYKKLEEKKKWIFGACQESAINRSNGRSIFSLAACEAEKIRAFTSTDRVSASKRPKFNRISIADSAKHLIHTLFQEKDTALHRSTCKITELQIRVGSGDDSGMIFLTSQ